MLDDFIRGGQIFSHKIRMLSQVLGQSVLAACIIASISTGFLSRNTFSKLDFPAGVSYLKSKSLIEVKKIFPGTKEAKIIASIKSHKTKMLAKDVVSHKSFKRAYHKIISFIWVSIILFLKIGTAAFVIITLIWVKFGKSSKEKKPLYKSRIFTEAEASHYIKAGGKASKIFIESVPLIKGKETSHILITGTTGSGKTNGMNELLPQIRDQKQSCIIVDLSGQITEKYYDESKGDILLSLFDERAKNWDFWGELEIGSNRFNRNLTNISSTFFAQDNKYQDPFWNNSGAVIFEDCVKTCIKDENQTIEYLDNLLSKITLGELGKKLKKTASAAYLDKDNEKTAASIRSNLATNTKILRYLSDKGSDLFTFKKWIEQKGSGWLFISGTPESRNLLIPLISLWMDIIMQKIMGLNEDPNRRIWLILDELPSLKKIPSLPTSLAEFRKYGGCILAAMQSITQLSEIYGSNMAASMLDQFNTKIIFRTEEPQLAKYISDSMGFMEYVESIENISYGAHEMRDGVSFTKQERKKPLISSNDIASLEDLECYLKLPDPIVRAVKLKMKYNE